MLQLSDAVVSLLLHCCSRLLPSQPDEFGKHNSSITNAHHSTHQSWSNDTMPHSVVGKVQQDLGVGSTHPRGMHVDVSTCFWHRSKMAAMIQEQALPTIRGVDDQGRIQEWNDVPALKRGHYRMDVVCYSQPAKSDHQKCLKTLQLLQVSTRWQGSCPLETDD